MAIGVEVTNGHRPGPVTGREVERPAEGTTGAPQQHRHVVRAEVGDGQVGVAVSVEVAHGHRERHVAGAEVGRRRKRPPPRPPRPRPASRRWSHQQRRPDDADVVQVRSSWRPFPAALSWPAERVCLPVDHSVNRQPVRPSRTMGCSEVRVSPGSAAQISVPDTPTPRSRSTGQPPVRQRIIDLSRCRSARTALRFVRTAAGSRRHPLKRRPLSSRRTVRRRRQSRGQ